MTHNEAEIWNAAIDAALRQYRHGVGAIHRLRVRPAIIIEHIGTTKKQDIVYDTDAGKPHSIGEE